MNEFCRPSPPTTCKDLCTHTDSPHHDHPPRLRTKCSQRTRSNNRYPTPASPGDGIRGGKWIGCNSMVPWKCRDQKDGPSDCEAEKMDFVERPGAYNDKMVFCVHKKENVKKPIGKNRFTKEQRQLIASAVLDSLTFAGGLSVPSIITTAVGILYSKSKEDDRRNNGGMDLDTMSDDAIRQMVRWSSVMDDFCMRRHTRTSCRDWP